MIRLVLVDDQTVVRRSLRARLLLEPDLEVICEASTGQEALTLVPQLMPDVVLMDVVMPEMDGIAATASLRKVVPQSVVVMLSIADDGATQAQAEEAVAVAFVYKSGAIADLLATIRQAAKYDQP